MKYSILLPLIILSILTIGCSSTIQMSQYSKPENEKMVATAGEVIADYVLAGYTEDMKLKSIDLLFRLTYIGRDKNSIKILYYEFATVNNRDLIKSDYTVAYSFDLDENTIISFKDLKIEIINITSSELTYELSYSTPCNNMRLDFLKAKSHIRTEKSITTPDGIENLLTDEEEQEFEKMMIDCSNSKY